MVKTSLIGCVIAAILANIWSPQWDARQGTTPIGVERGNRGRNPDIWQPSGPGSRVRGDAAAVMRSSAGVPARESQARVDVAQPVSGQLTLISQVQLVRQSKDVQAAYRLAAEIDLCTEVQASVSRAYAVVAGAERSPLPSQAKAHGLDVAQAQFVRCQSLPSDLEGLRAELLGMAVEGGVPGAAAKLASLRSLQGMPIDDRTLIALLKRDATEGDIRSTYWILVLPSNALTSLDRLVWQRALELAANDPLLRIDAGDYLAMLRASDREQPRSLALGATDSVDLENRALSVYRRMQQRRTSGPAL